MRGPAHPDRDAQFEHINPREKPQLKHGQPVISVDTKKKELVDGFKNPGQNWRPQGSPVLPVHDFLEPGPARPSPTACLTWSQSGLGQRGGGPRYRRLRGGDHPSLVGRVGSSALPACPVTAHHRRRRRQQRPPHPTLEMGAPAVGPTDGTDDFGLPSSSGHEQMEQNRAPAVLVHHRKLARPAIAHPCGSRQPHRGHPNHGDRTQGTMCTGHCQNVSQSSQADGGTDGRDQPEARNNSTATGTTVSFLAGDHN